MFSLHVPLSAPCQHGLGRAADESISQIQLRRCRITMHDLIRFSFYITLQIIITPHPQITSVSVDC